MLITTTHCNITTGFMIVSALVRLAGVPADTAIAAFQAMRAPGIYKPDYIKGLFDYFHVHKCVSAGTLMPAGTTTLVFETHVCVNTCSHVVSGC